MRPKSGGGGSREREGDEARQLTRLGPTDVVQCHVAVLVSPGLVRAAVPPVRVVHDEDAVLAPPA